MKTGIELIADERKRQIEVEGWDAEHDKPATEAQLVDAAVCYAKEAATNILQRFCGDKPQSFGIPKIWPWAPEWWKPTPNDPIRQLTKAGALIAAEIDRLLVKQAEDAEGKPFSVQTGSGQTLVLNPAPDSAHSCEACGGCENGHYCLLHSIGLKNCNLICCDDWESDVRADDHGGL